VSDPRHVFIRPVENCLKFSRARRTLFIGPPGNVLQPPNDRAAIAARTTGQVLGCITRADVFAPALEQPGFVPDRIIIIERAIKRRSLLAASKACAIPDWAASSARSQNFR
jgi:hypothetical protein